jgi:hypothetical protein
MNSTGKSFGKKRTIAPWAKIHWALFIPMGMMLAIFLSSFLP